jgi:hypothetical protein
LRSSSCAKSVCKLQLFTIIAFRDKSQNFGQPSKILLRISPFMWYLPIDPRHSTIAIDSICRFELHTRLRIASVSRLPFRLNLRNTGDWWSNLRTWDVETSLPNESFVRTDGCLARMFHFLHTGATHWHRSLTLSRENISRINSGGRSVMFVCELCNSPSVLISLLFRTCSLLILRVILLTFAWVPVSSQFSHLRFIFIKYRRVLVTRHGCWIYSARN